MSIKKMYLDTTFLHYGDDLRGIPQVIFQLVRLFLQHRELGSVHFIATKKVRSAFLIPLGVPEERIDTVPAVPLVANDIRLHGFLCGIRYRKIKRCASFIIHPEYRTVLKSDIPQIVLYHDFIFLDDYGRSRRPGARTALQWLYRFYVKYKLALSTRAACKIAVSESTKQCLLALYPSIPAGTVTVLHNGIRCLTHNAVQPKSGCSSRVTFLAVGGVDDPRKNYPLLIQNIGIVAQGRPFHLHIVGKCRPVFLKTLSALVAALNVTSSVSFHGTVSDDRLRDFYTQADFFLFPSLFEGFGLPLVEAMAHGCIVCAFNNSSVPEIGGDAIIMAGNNDFPAWGEAISALINDSAAYRRLSEKAIGRAKQFSEERMFERYGAYFRKSLGRQ